MTGSVDAFAYSVRPTDRPTTVRVGPLDAQGVAPPAGVGFALVAAPLADPAHPAALRLRAFAERATGGGLFVSAPDGGAAGDEPLKSIDYVARLWRAFAQAGLDRRGRVVVIGGGALLDAAGFAAAAWHRGVPVWNVPSTLLAQVDAALGGKTGLDLDDVKNQIGFVRQPECIFADAELLSTLPPAERTSGFGEIAKTALLAGSPMFEQVLTDAPALVRGEAAATARAVSACLRYKAGVVSADPDESLGSRFVLNAGHTIGHVYEAAAAARGNPLPHGLCVAAGLRAEALALPGSDVPSVLRMLTALGVATALPPVERETAERLLRADKKRAAEGRIRVPQILRPGDVACRDVDVSALADAASRSA